MSKIAANQQKKLKAYVFFSFGDAVLSTDGEVLLCKVCEREVIAEKKSQLVQHLNGSKHKSKATRKYQRASSSIVQMAPSLEGMSK